LISQVSGYYAHMYDVKATTNDIRKVRGKAIKGNQSLYEKWCDRLNWATTSLNGLSLLSLIAGIITIVLFFSNNR
jgi:hypothetical protein